MFPMYFSDHLVDGNKMPRNVALKVAAVKPLTGIRFFVNKKVSTTFFNTTESSPYDVINFNEFSLLYRYSVSQQ